MNEETNGYILPASRMPSTVVAPAMGQMSGLLGGQPLRRPVQKQLDRDIEQFTANTILVIYRQQAEQGLARMQAQANYELARFTEQAEAELATMHETGRGQIADAALVQVAATGALADSIAKANPMIAPQAFKIVEAQATGAAIALMRW
ncbi:hypothetical protein [Microbacterium sp. NPDC076895]|uniref:hypothetical protein n=1 Tax=Microbacterium sp. NPDC076895 TaxID=3154957 RepID=UPI00342D6BDA